MRASPAADPGFLEAFAEIVSRIAAPLAGVDAARLPVRMYLAGGAAVHFYTGARTTEDVDAVFSLRVALPEDLDVNYVDAAGRPRLLYFDRQYNDTFGLLHECANDDSRALTVLGVDPRVLDVRVLSPTDLAVSKLGRFAANDRSDIESLARAGLVTARAVRKRAEEAVAGYVGSVERVRTSIELAVRLIELNLPKPATSAAAKSPRKRPR